MRKSLNYLGAAASLLALAIPLFAGGFMVLLGNPEASEKARALQAVLTIQLAGCHQPENAAVSATAIGNRGGLRESIPLKLLPLAGSPGMYAITRQWPFEGKWVLEFVATEQDRIATTLVQAGPAGIDRQSAKYYAKRLTPDVVSEFLANTPAPAVARK